MRDTGRFKFEGAVSRAEAAQTLMRIAEGIRARALSLSLGGEHVTVYPQGEMTLEIEAKDKKGTTRMEIEIAWRPPNGRDED